MEEKQHTETTKLIGKKTKKHLSLQIFLSLLLRKVISTPWDKVKWTTQSPNFKYSGNY